MRQAIHIRTMEPDDAAVCGRWMAATPLWQRHGHTEQSATARLLKALSEGAIIFVASEGESPVMGLVWVVPLGAFDRSGYIRWIAVDPAYQGRGVGQQLMVAAEEYLHQTVHDVFLLCSDFNVDAQRFYQRQGYAQVGAVPDFVMPGVSELIFHKQLDQIVTLP